MKLNLEFKPSADPMKQSRLILTHESGSSQVPHYSPYASVTAADDMVEQSFAVNPEDITSLIALGLEIAKIIIAMVQRH